MIKKILLMNKVIVLLLELARPLYLVVQFLYTLTYLLKVFSDLI